jgi:hypothetical protein
MDGGGSSTCGFVVVGVVRTFCEKAREVTWLTSKQ